MVILAPISSSPCFVVQADAGVEEKTAPELSVEEVWCGAEGPPSIADLALEQKGIYYPLVQHHWLLASLLHAAMTFKVKVKPLSLFDSKVSASLSQYSYWLYFPNWCQHRCRTSSLFIGGVGMS